MCESLALSCGERLMSISNLQSRFRQSVCFRINALFGLAFAIFAMAEYYIQYNIKCCLVLFFSQER